MPSPGRFEVRHLPVLADELVRIQAVVEAFHEVQYRAAQTLVKRVLRSGGDPGPVFEAIEREFTETLRESDANLQRLLQPWMTRDLADLRQRSQALQAP